MRWFIELMGCSLFGAKPQQVQILKRNGTVFRSAIFRLIDAVKGQAEVKLRSPVVNRGQLRAILAVAKDRQFVVDEMKFEPQKKTVTILVTPY